MARRGLKDAIEAAGTLALVLFLYGAPVILSVLIGVFRTPLHYVPGTTDRMGEREAVVWTPPMEVRPDAEGDALVDAEPDAGEARDETAESVDADAIGDPELVLPADAVTDARRVRVRGKRILRKRAPSKRRELTKQEQRKFDKRKRKRARQAERKQCAELKRQILQVDENEWWFGREIANCYRTHLEQFDMLGGAYFSENERGKSIGVGVRVSRSKRGEPARLAGFRSGDVIQSVNGIRVRGWGGVSLAATQLLRGHVKVKRIRDDEVEVVHLRVVSESALEERRQELQAVASGEQ